MAHRRWPAKPQFWSVQPMLTQAPNLWKDCVLCLPMWETPDHPSEANNPPTRIENIAESEFFTVVASSTRTSEGSRSHIYGRERFRHGTLRASTDGFRVDTTTATGPRVLPAVGDWTVFWFGEVIDPAASGHQQDAQPLFSQHNAGNTAGRIVIYSSTTLGDANNAPRMWDGDLGQLAYHPVSSLDAGYQACAYTRNSTGFDVYLDGVKGIQSSSNTASSIDGGGSNRLFRDLSATNRFHVGSHVFMAFWHRGLTDEEIQLLSRDPFIMLRRRVR